MLRTTIHILFMTNRGGFDKLNIGYNALRVRLLLYRSSLHFEINFSK